MNHNDQSISEEEFNILSVPIDKAILMCDNEFDLLKLACVMLQRTKEIFETHLGVDGRKQMFKDLV